MCRTIHLHIQICWSHLHVNRVVGIILNVIGWTVPAIMLGLVFVVADIAYTISDHCSIRVDWIARLLIIPLIVEISLALFVQILTFGYCVNVYLKSLSEPPPPTSDIFEGGPVSINSFHSTRYPYRKAFARVRKVCRLFWPVWFTRCWCYNGGPGRNASRWFSSGRCFQLLTISFRKNICRFRKGWSLGIHQTQG